MPQEPLVANYRLIFRYTVATEQHKHQSYLECTASGDASGFDAIGRVGGGGNVGVSTLVDPFFLIWAPFYRTADTTFDSWELQKRTGGSFFFIASGAATQAPTGTPGAVLATGICVSGKDALNHNLPRYMYDTNVAVPLKDASYGAMGASEKGIVDYYFNVGLAPLSTDYWNWGISKGGYIPNHWLAVVADSNEKLRKIRGLK